MLKAEKHTPKMQAPNQTQNAGLHQHFEPRIWLGAYVSLRFLLRDHIKKHTEKNLTIR